MHRAGSVLLELSPQGSSLGKGKALSDGLSAVVQIGRTLWVANDETVSLERLSRREDDSGGEPRYGDHTRFALADYLRLPVPPSPDASVEADVEGLDYHDGYLWLVGSHSLKRGKPKDQDRGANNAKHLAKVSRDGNRFLLARIPVVERGGTPTLEQAVMQGGRKLTAARLRGDALGNELTEALARDEHLQPFLAIPGKDNGFDIEGLAAAGERLFLGLRGPVLRGWAVILEVQPTQHRGDASLLTLANIGSRRYRKHFLQLGGLGIRDLCTDGNDLLILAGPSMDLDGPVRLWRWPQGTQSNGDSLVFDKALPPALDIPFGRGVDHAEGMTAFAVDGTDIRSVLVVYDAASQHRQQGAHAVKADIFTLAAAGA